MSTFIIKGTLNGENGVASTIDSFTVKDVELMDISDFDQDEGNKNINIINTNDEPKKLKDKLKKMVSAVHFSTDADVDRLKQAAKEAADTVHGGGSLIGTTTNNLIRPFTNTSNDARHIITNTIKSTLNTENLFNRRGLTGTKRFRSPFGKSKSRRNRRNTRSRK